MLTMPCRVPQGSVLGPMLVILYSRDIPNALTYSKTIMFANDTTLYYSASNIAEVYCHFHGEVMHELMYNILLNR
jgi:hypothetical protein